MLIGAKVSDNFVTHSAWFVACAVSRTSGAYDERWRNSLREFQIKRIDVNRWCICERRRQFILSQDDRFLGSFLEKPIDKFVSFGGLSK